MRKTQPVDKKIKRHLASKRNELVWALSMQDYTQADIGNIFNLNRSTILRIIEEKPARWTSPWWKIDKLKDLK